MRVGVYPALYAWHGLRSLAPISPRTWVSWQGWYITLFLGGNNMAGYGWKRYDQRYDGIRFDHRDTLSDIRKRDENRICRICGKSFTPYNNGTTCRSCLCFLVSHGAIDQGKQRTGKQETTKNPLRWAGFLRITRISANRILCTSWVIYLYHKQSYLSLSKRASIAVLIYPLTVSPTDSDADLIWLYFSIDTSNGIRLYFSLW